MPTIVATSRCATHGFSKQPQTSIRLLTGLGVEHDAHSGETTQHLYRVRRDPTQPNLCQVHLFPAEMLAELAQHGFPLEPGEIGENILTQDVDLLTLPEGTLLYLGAKAMVKVTGLRTPCSQIDGYRNGLQQHLWGPRDDAGKKTRRGGIMSIVIESGEVFPGDALRVELPPLPHRPLGPV